MNPTHPVSHPVIDGHTHICGSGNEGTGCFISRRLLSSFAFRYMRWKLGLGVFGEVQGLDGAVRKSLFADLDAAPSVDYVVLYGHDKVYRDGELREDLTHMHTPNDYVLRLTKEHPKILAAASVHPDRPDALEELERCAAAGAVMLKWLPPNQGMDPADRRHRPFYEALARLGIPLVAHTGGEHTVPMLWPEYCDPARLELALDCGVNVIAAHSGTKSGLVDPEYYATFAALARRYPNCWGDTAAFTSPNRMRHVGRLLKDPEVLAKTVHGSDYPVPITAWSALRHLPLGEIRRIQALPSPLERDVAIKRSAGLPEAHFRTLGGLLPARIWAGRSGAGKGPADVSGE